MKKRILILGATGMAGHMVYYYFKSLNSYEIYTVCFRNKISDDSIIVDIYDTDKLKKILKNCMPDYIINCIGVLIKGSLKSLGNAIYINAYFPHLLLRLIAEETEKSKLIHISTDCVFSGNKGYYSDDDIKDSFDIYGMTKNLGEVIDDQNLTLRTSIIGPEIKENGEGLFQWIFGQRRTGQVMGYNKSLWGGVTTLELAKAIQQCIQTDISGLFQLTNGKKISKYDLIKIIIDQYNLKIDLKKNDSVISDKSIKPSHRDGFSYIVPTYKLMIEELYRFMFEHKDIYQLYLG
jgi:dTDP-4-dehydrorhamnose reductase